MRRIITGLAIAVLFACRKHEAAPPAAQPTNASTTSSSTAIDGTETAVTSTESAVASEVNPPGDIPDSQAFVRFTSSAGGYSLEVPEGWARSESGAAVTFADKLDGVRVTIMPASAAPTSSTAQQNEAKTIQQSGRAVAINSVKDVSLPSGPAVVINYASNSDPNPVTNRQVRLENQSFLYFKNGKEAVMTLWAPKGADNVDQWNRMSKSFQWQ